MMYPHLMTSLKTVLRTRGWTYARLGEAIGLSESGVKKIFIAEDGSVERVVRICAALGITLEDLLELADTSPGPWRLTKEQEALFRRDPRCWWFLRVLSAHRWDVDAVVRNYSLSDVKVEGWLAALERRAIIRRSESGTVTPDAAAGRPWQGESDFGDAVVAPQQDALVTHARARIRHKDRYPLPGLTECGSGQMWLTEPSIQEFKQALRDLVEEFATRSRREQRMHGLDALHSVGVLTVMTPYSLSDIDPA